jgi:hypothetical protein
MRLAERRLIRGHQFNLAAVSCADRGHNKLPEWALCSCRRPRGEVTREAQLSKVAAALECVWARPMGALAPLTSQSCPRPESIDLQICAIGSRAEQACQRTTSGRTTSVAALELDCGQSGLASSARVLNWWMIICGGGGGGGEERDVDAAAAAVGLDDGDGDGGGGGGARRQHVTCIANEFQPRGRPASGDRAHLSILRPRAPKVGQRRWKQVFRLPV